jgi:hypothetical protein
VLSVTGSYRLVSYRPNGQRRVVDTFWTLPEALRARDGLSRHAKGSRAPLYLVEDGESFLDWPDTDEWMPHLKDELIGDVGLRDEGQRPVVERPPTHTENGNDSLSSLPNQADGPGAESVSPSHTTASPANRRAGGTEAAR